MGWGMVVLHGSRVLPVACQPLAAHVPKHVQMHRKSATHRRPMITSLVPSQLGGWAGARAHTRKWHRGDRALPERWVTVHSGDMGYTIGPLQGEQSENVLGVLQGPARPGLVAAQGDTVFDFAQVL